MKRILRSVLTSPLRLYDFFTRCRWNYDTYRIRIQGAYPEAVVSSPLRLLQKEKSSFPQLLRKLELAGLDPKIKTAVITLGPNRLGFARTLEVARAVASLREKGKYAAAVIEGGGTREYVIASRCDHVVMTPPASLFLTGLSLESMFLGELLSNFAVEPDLLSEGKYKNAAEMFTRKSPSKFAKEMMTKLAADLHAEFVAEIAKGRNVSEVKAREWIDQGPYTPTAAKEAGLIDEIAYSDDYMRELKKSGRKSRVVGAADHDRAFHRFLRIRNFVEDAPIVALLTASGPITDQTQQGAVHVSTPAFTRAISALRKNDKIKAVVLRVASPGGSGLASDLIHRELIRLKKKKPLVVSMGDLAASGGYYLAMTGDTVMTESTTLTGSIGVITGKFSLRGLYKKLGISKEIYSQGKNAGILSDYEKFSDEEREKMASINRHFYQQFTEKVGSARGLSPKEVNHAAQGRVFVGAEALKLSLADRSGGLRDAIREAAERAGMKPGEYPRLVVCDVLRASLLNLPNRFGVSAGLKILSALATDLEMMAEFSGSHAYFAPVLPRCDDADFW